MTTVAVVPTTDARSETIYHAVVGDKQARQATLDQAYVRTPGRFFKGAPRVLALHSEVCINRVEPQTTKAEL